MKAHIKKLLSRSPALYRTSKQSLDLVRGVFSDSAKVTKAGKKNIALLAHVSKLVRALGLRSIEVTDSEVIVEVDDGCRFLLDTKQVNPLLSIPTEGFFERKETNFINRMVKPGHTVFDIGANFGWYTVHFSKLVSDSGSVHAFEPFKGVFSELERNIALNSCKNVILVNKAVGKENGEIMLFTPEDLGSAFTSQHNYYGKKSSAELITLDSYVRDRKLRQLDFIKADVEGGELNILLGAEEILERYAPDIFMEVQDYHTERFGYKAKEIFVFLQKKDYHSYCIDSNGLLQELTNFDSLPDYNFFFTTKPKVAIS